MRAGKRRSGKTRKSSKWLDWALEEAALAATGSKGSYPAAQYARLRPRREHKKALGAAKHSIVCAAWHMLSTGELYRDLGRDYFQRRAPDTPSASSPSSNASATPSACRRSTPHSAQAHFLSADSMMTVRATSAGGVSSLGSSIRFRAMFKCSLAGKTYAVVLVAVAIAAGGCGDEGGATNASDEASRESDTPPAVETATTTAEAELSCPFDGAEIAQRTTIRGAMDLLAGNSGDTVCYLGTPGSDGEIGIDNTQPLIEVSREDESKCDYENIEPAFLPYQGGHRAAPEYGEGAWKVVLPSAESGTSGYDAAGYFLLNGTCVEIYLFNRGGTEAETEQALDDLVALAKD